MNFVLHPCEGVACTCTARHIPNCLNCKLLLYSCTCTMLRRAAEVELSHRIGAWTAQDCGAHFLLGANASKGIGQQMQHMLQAFPCETAAHHHYLHFAIHASARASRTNMMAGTAALDHQSFHLRWKRCARVGPWERPNPMPSAVYCTEPYARRWISVCPAPRGAGLLAKGFETRAAVHTRTRLGCGCH